MKLLNFLSITLLFFAFKAHATNSITWQKLALEEKIQRRYSNILSSHLKDNQYLVEIEANISDPGGPNFDPTGHKSGDRVSDIDLANSRGDYIAFSKMGLEVPVLEKFLDKDRTHLMNLYRYNEAFDLFKNITAVKVNIFLSDKLPEELVDIIKGIVQNSKISLEGVKPTFNFNSIKMEWVDPNIEKNLLAEKKEIPKEEVEPKIWKKDWLEWASRWGNAVGLILGAIILGIITFMMFRQWRNFMENYVKQAKDENKQESLDNNTEESTGQAVDESVEDQSQEDQVASIEGFDRFQQCLEQQPQEAVNMVRRWINEPEEKYKLILQGISQQATAEQMDRIMLNLSEFQRDQWREFIGKHLDSKDLSEANKLLFYEVIKAFLVPTKIKDSDLLNLIMDLNTTSAVDFLNSYPEQIGIMMNILSPTVINNILSKVNDATVDRWLQEGALFKTQHLEAQLPKLKDALFKFKESHTESPFIQRIISMLSNVEANRETALYRALAKATNSEVVFETAKKNFPSELVIQLPPTLLKEVIQSYPMSKRVEIIASRFEEEQSTLINALADEGTPARDLIDMELENISKDKSLRSSIESRRDHIWEEFISSVRVVINKDPSYNKYKESLIKDWSKSLVKELHSIAGQKVA